MPCALTSPILGFGVVAVTQVAYEAEGWGIGELVVVDERVVWHELPWPRAEPAGMIAAAAPLDPSQTPTHPGAGPVAGATVGRVVSRKRSRRDRGFVSD